MTSSRAFVLSISAVIGERGQALRAKIGQPCDAYVSTGVFQSNAFQFNALQVAVVMPRGKRMDVEFAPLAESVLDNMEQAFTAEGWWH